ncbi:hypothetical protein E0493_17145 [Roseomonas sp. M0104]|uniref:Uncharacterized protein n=1 Tax=Teichococcus coralli TaxID=2545983 RepID=A0A845BDT6_9PROT|nr:hypothetical protein [Pseudoroseomonas coralli]MXP65075.1 hypothetical protein [Pseudoroseomonas coralli]
MTITRSLFAALALLGLAGAAQAQDLTVTDRGENFAVQYDPSYTGNIVGGGYARFAQLGQNTTIAYADPSIGNRAPGTPVDLGGHSDVVYLQQAPAATMLAAR